MNRHVNAIAGRLSLRTPQRRSLEILDRITEIAPPTKGSRSRRGPGRHSQRVSVGDRFRTRVPLGLFCSGHGRGQDPPHGGLHQLSAPGARVQELFRAGAQPDHLQQADRRLHAEYAQVRFQGHCGVRHRRAGHHHRRQLRVAGGQPVRPGGAVQGQHLQYLEDQFRSSRRKIAQDQAAGRIYRRKLLRLPCRPGRPGADYG